MEIPEELLKCSEKELKEILKTNNVYKATYLIKDGSIRHVEGRIKDRFLIDGTMWQYYDVNRKFKPLTFPLYREIVSQSIWDNVNNWTTDRLFKWAVKEFNNVYGEEYVDGDEVSNNIIVYFPEITISNSVEQSHIMRDIYLRFKIWEYGIKLTGLKRGTLTDVEYRNRYTFSHVSNSYEELWDWRTDFCFGDTDIATLKNKLEKQGKQYCFRNLSIFLHAIEQYLSWESLEGVPYSKIDTVIYDKNRWREEIKPVSAKMLDDTLRNISDFTYEFVPSDEGYDISLTEESKNKIADFLTISYPEECSLYMDGRSVYERTIDLDNVNRENNIYFKGEWKPFIVVKTSQEIVLPKRINNEVLNWVVQKIEKKFNQYFKNKRINEYS